MLLCVTLRVIVCYCACVNACATVCVNGLKCNNSCVTVIVLLRVIVC